MHGLIFKELYENRKWLIFTYVTISGMFVIQSLFLWLGVIKGEQAVMLAAAGSQLIAMIFAQTLNTMIFAYDERRLWAGFITSTPLAARGQVKSKYILVILNLMTAFSLCLIFDMVSCALCKDVQGSSAITMLFLWLLILMEAIEIPFITRFGNKKGNNIRSYIFIGILFIVIVYALFGDISFFTGEKDIYDWMHQLIKGEIGEREMIWIHALFPYISVGAYFLSYHISCKLYQKGAESYEA